MDARSTGAAAEATQGLLNAARCALWIVDLQARLLPAIDGADRLLANAGVLVDAARLLDVPVCATEQNPAGLGPTVDVVAERLSREEILEKRHFCAARAPGFAAQLARMDRSCAVIAGSEAHVCVQQTAFGLLEHGLSVAVVSDAVGSRAPANRDAALDRLARAGADIVTTEMVLFEWVEHCDHPAFRPLLALIK
ncbi:MAG: isochorismatase family protein [Alphaproteobacteria bacterium]|nr:isochorismatase family protein [Alphaproteobacteria bacterium]